MVSIRLIFALTTLMLAIGSFASAVELPNTHFKPLGPEVDLTLKDATSRRGYLLSFVNGVITMELESGERLMKESNEITSLHFIPKIQPLTARQTELSGLEMQKVKDFQLQERKSSQDRKPGLSKAEEAEFRRLRKKVGIHIEALERELPDVHTPDEAREYLKELVHYYAHYGVQPVEIKSALKQAVESIKDEKVKQNVVAYQNEVIRNMEDRFLKPKVLEKRPFLFPPTNKADKPTVPSTTKSGDKPAAQ